MPYLAPLLEIVIGLLVAGNAAYLIFALACVLSHRRVRPMAASASAATTVLRPLCGDEVGLGEALESLLSQVVDDANVRFIFGVASARDAALPIVQTVATRHPQRRVSVVVDATLHGANPKVSNLINMSSGGLDPVIVVTDSDVILPPGSLRNIIESLGPSDVGAATALYRGRPGTPGSVVQKLGSLYLDGWFLPTALVHARIKSASVCYGQLTAIKREILPGGGFAALADVLADDTELGHLARKTGKRIVFGPDVVEVLVNDASLPALFRHELRWARTIRALQPQGYFASVFMHPGPLPLLLAALSPTPASWLTIVGLALLRWMLVAATHRGFGRSRGVAPVDPLTLWVREQLYFAVWLRGFFGRRIVWRGRSLYVGADASVEEPPQGLATATPALSA